jgi:hypothetical protein
MRWAVVAGAVKSLSNVEVFVLLSENSSGLSLLVLLPGD